MKISNVSLDNDEHTSVKYPCFSACIFLKKIVNRKKVRQSEQNSKNLLEIITVEKKKAY